MITSKISRLVSIYLLLVFFVLFPAGISWAMGTNTLTLNVGFSKDDARNIAGNEKWVTDAPTQYIGQYKSTDYWSGWRWQNVNIVPGAVIKRASLDLYSAGLTRGKTVKAIFYGEASDNSLAFNVSDQKPEDKIRTSSSVVKNFNVSLWSQQGFGVEAIDVTAIVQEIVNRNGWQSGNSLSIIAHNNDSYNNSYIGFSTFDRSNDRGARLIIEYDPEAAASTPPASSDTAVTNYQGWNSQVMAWIYPGDPACAATTELQDGRVIDYLKAEYFTLGSDGVLSLLATNTNGCNAYSPENVTALKNNSNFQFVTVSADLNSMKNLVGNSIKRTQAVSTLIDFVKNNNLSGVELDFEGYGGWSDIDYANYKLFINQLGNSLHVNSKKLMLVGPPIGNTKEQSYYAWRYEDFVNLPVDFLVVMAYDYMYDWGAGTPVAPDYWVRDIIQWAKARVDLEKLVIGLPAYGYHGTTGDYQIKIDTFNQSSLYPGFFTAQRDASSHEMMWEQSGVTYVYQDITSLNSKRELIESLGIKYVSIYHLGGNAWFSLRP